MSIIKGLFSLLGIILLVIAVLFVDFTYKTFSVSQRSVKTDAIVVLAGGKGRVEEGVRLFRDHQARYLFLIGVDPAVRKGDLFRERKGEGGGERVFLENVSRNTLENALYARDLLLKKEVHSCLYFQSWICWEKIFAIRAGSGERHRALPRSRY